MSTKYINEDLRKLKGLTFEIKIGSGRQSVTEWHKPLAAASILNSGFVPTALTGRVKEENSRIRRITEVERSSLIDLCDEWDAMK